MECSTALGWSLQIGSCGSKSDEAIIVGLVAPLNVRQ